MTKRRTRPRYLIKRKRADGAIAYYWDHRRRPGTKRLSDDPTEAWQQAELLNEQMDLEAAGLAAKNKRLTPLPGTIAHLIDEYRASSDFQDLAAKTRKGYEAHLTWLRDGFGDLIPAEIDARFIQKLKTKMRATPYQANARVAVIRLLYSFGRRHGLAPDVNPAAGFRRVKVKPRHQVWTADEIARFLASARPSMRLAFLLGLFTLQREGDLIRLPWSAYDGLRIELRQQKTGKLISARAHSELKTTLDATSRKATTILVSEATGRPYDEHHFRHVFGREREAAGIRTELQFRDLRRTGAVILGRRGESTLRISALGGWSISQTAKILETYVPLDAEMADAAVASFEESNVF